MRYAIEVTNGVELLSGSTPLPQGAIEPIINWDEIIIIPWFYLKVINDLIVEKTEAEKQAYHDANPPTTKELQEQAHLHLEDTDWYVVRLVDPGAGNAIPQDIVDSRADAREIL